MQQRHDDQSPKWDDYRYEFVNRKHIDTTAVALVEFIAALGCLCVAQAAYVIVRSLNAS